MLYNKKSRPSHSQVAEYWESKFISKDFEIIDYYDKGAIPVIVDCSSPACFACGEGNYKIYRNKKYESLLEDKRTMFRVWNLPESKCFLQRSHIIPRMLDGENQVPNYFLLCKQCHQESPDYQDSRYFFSYIAYVRQNNFAIIQKRNHELLKSIYITAMQMRKNILNLESSFYNIKLNDKKMGLHITSFSSYTIAAAIVDTLETIDFTRITKNDLKLIEEKYNEVGIKWDYKKY